MRTLVFGFLVLTHNPPEPGQYVNNYNPVSVKRHSEVLRVYDRDEVRLQQLLNIHRVS